MIFWKSLSKLYSICLLLEKLVNRKHFSVKRKLGLSYRKVLFFYFEWKTLSRSYKKFRNIILFADYIKFGHQTFNCYIYIILNIFFLFHPLEFDFYINLDPYFYNCYFLFPYYFLIEIFFYLSNSILILFIVTYFIWNNLWNDNYYYFNFFVFQLFF